MTTPVRLSLYQGPGRGLRGDSLPVLTVRPERGLTQDPSVLLVFCMHMPDTIYALVALVPPRLLHRHSFYPRSVPGASQDETQECCDVMTLCSCSSVLMCRCALGRTRTQAYLLPQTITPHPMPPLPTSPSFHSPFPPPGRLAVCPSLTPLAFLGSARPLLLCPCNTEELLQSQLRE